MTTILGNGFDTEAPHGNSNVWKYMGLDKFLDLLITQEFHFQNLSLLSDKYEGGAKLPSYPKFAGTTSPQMQMKLPSGAWDAPRDADIQFSSFVHCWSLQSHESYALWKIYLSGAKQGIAITSSLAKLRREIISRSSSVGGQVYMDKVIYFKPNPGEMYSEDKRIFMKMPYYQFEEEWRIAISRNYKEDRLDHIPSSIRLKVDLKDLIKDVYISPFMSSPLRKSLISAIRKISPAIADKIRVSEILDQ